MGDRKFARACFLVSLFVLPIAGYLVLRQYAALLVPYVHQISPGCVFHDLTGIKCPGCGGTRAFAAMLQGDWKRVITLNAFWIPTLLILLVEYANAWLVWAGVSFRYPKWVSLRIFALKSYAVILIVFVVTRNIFDF